MKKKIKCRLTEADMAKRHCPLDPFNCPFFHSLGRALRAHGLSICDVGCETFTYFTPWERLSAQLPRRVVHAMSHLMVGRPGKPFSYTVEVEV